jgi:hypothetical protein
MKIKITTGFNSDQKFTIDSEETHKAYYLFNNPDKRGTFSNGVALIGKDIRNIQPDYNAEMGWNPTHQLDDFDWEEIRQKGVDRRFQVLLSEAKRVSYLVEKEPHILVRPLSECSNKLLE